MTRGKTKKELEKDLRNAIIPQLIVKMGLYDEFKSNPEKVRVKIKKYIHQNKNFFDSGDFMVVCRDYSKQISNAKKLINKLNLAVLNEAEKNILYNSLFISFLSWLEGIINNLLSEELEIKEVPSDEIYNILQKISFEDKFGWFLKVLTGKDLRKNKIWTEIRRFTSLRHFFIHDKPTPNKIEGKRKKITLEDLKKFLDILLRLSKLTKKIKSKELKDMEKKMRELKI